MKKHVLVLVVIAVLFATAAGLLMLLQDSSSPYSSGHNDGTAYYSCDAEGVDSPIFVEIGSDFDTTAVSAFDAGGYYVPLAFVGSEAEIPFSIDEDYGVTVTACEVIPSEVYMEQKNVLRAPRAFHEIADPGTKQLYYYRLSEHGRFGRTLTYYDTDGNKLSERTIRQLNAEIEARIPRESPSYHILLQKDFPDWTE